MEFLPRVALWIEQQVAATSKDMQQCAKKGSEEVLLAMKHERKQCRF